MRHFFCDWAGHQSGLLKKYPFLKKEASVLVLLRQSVGGVEVFLTQRSDAVTHHQKEVSFPGGRRDPRDRNPVETALREAHEETGLPPDYVRVVSVPVPFRTRYDYALFPVVGVLTDNSFEPKNNPEVDVSFWLPLDRFLSSERHAIRSLTIKNKELRTHVFLDDIPGGSESIVVFGITSFICIIVAMIFHQRKPSFTFPAQQMSLSKETMDKLSWRDIILLMQRESSRSLIRDSANDEASRKSKF